MYRTVQVRCGRTFEGAGAGPRALATAGLAPAGRLPLGRRPLGEAAALLMTRPLPKADLCPADCRWPVGVSGQGRRADSRAARAGRSGDDARERSAERAGPEAADPRVARQGGLEVRRGFPPTLVVRDHDRGAELRAPAVGPVGLREHDPFIREPAADLAPGEALGGGGRVRCQGFHHELNFGHRAPGSTFRQTQPPGAPLPQGAAATGVAQSPGGDRWRGARGACHDRAGHLVGPLDLPERQRGIPGMLGRMVAPSVALASFADLAALPGNVRAEVIHGVITEKASPSAEHGESQASVSAVLIRRFQRQPGGRWPGGWWLGTEIEVEYEAHEIYVHDVVGWRRERMPERPTGRPVRVRPDWACELLSPSNAKRDLVDKLKVLHANGVPHYWIVDPHEQTLIVHRWEPRGYLVVLSAAAGDLVRAEPFEAVELHVSALFGLEEDEE